jgi:hypothetical protein
MYQELIDQMFLDDPNNEDRSGDMKLHPSAISGCERNAIYSARGEEVSNPRDVRFTRIMGNGTMFHSRLQAYLLTRFPGIILEAPVKWGPISGSADALLPRDEFGPLDAIVYQLQEYKTISPNGKRFLQPSRGKGAKYPPRDGGPKPEHVTQTRIYYLGLSKMGTVLTDTIRIVYIDRDDWSTLEFEVEPWTKEEGEAYLETLAELEAHLMDGTLPDKKPDSYWLCKMCEFRTVCKGWE